MKEEFLLQKTGAAFSKLFAMLLSKNVPVCVLLTATVQVRQEIILTARRDTHTRLEDYKKAFSWWLKQRDVQRLVFVENSGFDLSELAEIAARVPEKTVEFLSFTAPSFDGALGKGYGEMLCLQQCLERSALLTEASRFLKVTGRYSIANASSLLSFVALRNEADVICDMRLNLTWADSRAFGGSVEFLRMYLCPMLGELNDSKDSTFERVLARAAHLAMADHGLWIPPPFPIAIQGVSGSRGHVWRASLKEQWVSRLRQALLARTLSSGPR